MFENAEDGYHVTDKGVMTRVFDPDGRLVQIYDPAGNAITLAYTAGLLTSIQHACGDTFTLAYTGGRVTTLTDAAGRTTSYADGGDTLSTATTSAGAVTAYAYHTSPGPARYGLEAVTLPDGPHRYFSYDPNGRLASRSSDGGAEQSLYTYPSLGIVDVENGAHEVTRLFFDSGNQPAQIIAPGDETTTFDRNDREQVTAATFPLADRWETTYDTNGSRTMTIDPIGHTVWTLFTPDFARLDWFRDDRGVLTDYTYDANGDLTQLLYPGGKTLQYQRDAQSHISKFTNARAQAIVFTRDARGNPTQRQVQGGDTTTITPDTSGRPVQVANGHGSVTLEYDSADRPTHIADTASRTLDPLTEDLPEDAASGFLPPNDDTGRGEGHVSFIIKPKPGLANGTKLTNKATIVFDAEAPMDTNEVLNTIGMAIRSDVDVSGSVDALDVQLVINAALGLDVYSDCDVNGDGGIDALDVQLAINAALGLA